MNERILIIEDDQAILKLLQRGLAYEGYTVDTAVDGRMGLIAARDHTPDLVVLDWMLPGMDGLEVCHRLRTGGSIPILMLTAKDTVQDRIQGLDAGADDYMVKPFNLDELLARVRALLRRGARKGLAEAAALGAVEDAQQLLPRAGGEVRHRALTLASQFGHAAIVQLLLDAGEDPNRYNPIGFHSHSTPLHQAVAAGHGAVVRLLVERGARLDLKDTLWQGTPLGWASHEGKAEIEEYLRAQETRREGASGSKM